MSRDNLICGLVIGWSAVVLLLLVVFGLPNNLGRGAALAALFAIYLLDRHLRRRESTRPRRLP